MKIGPTLFPFKQPYRMKPAGTAAVDATGVKKGPADAKQIVRDAALRQIADMRAALANRGEDDPRARLLIDKFKSGKKLAPDEMYYLRLHAPGESEWIERIARERETLEQYMRFAPTRTDVQMMVLFATHRAARNESAEHRLVRARQFADAQVRYMQTNEYLSKPHRFQDRRPGF